MDAKELEDVERLMAYRDNSFLVTDERKRQDLLALADAVPGLLNHIKEQSRLLDTMKAEMGRMEKEGMRLIDEQMLRAQCAEKALADAELQVGSLKAALQKMVIEGAGKGCVCGCCYVCIARAALGMPITPPVARPDYLCAARINSIFCDLVNAHEGLHCKFGQIAETTIWWKVGDANAMLDAVKSYPTTLPVAETRNEAWPVMHRPGCLADGECICEPVFGPRKEGRLHDEVGQITDAQVKAADAVMQNRKCEKCRCHTPRPPRLCECGKGPMDHELKPDCVDRV